MDDQERASLDLPRRVEIHKPPADPPAGPEPPLRWPKWTWPVGLLVRDLPIVLAIVLLAEGFVRAGAWLGVEYFQAVPVEERAAYRVCAYLGFVLAASFVRAFAWIFRPQGKESGGPRASSRRTRVALRMLLLPFFLAAALAWVALRHLGLFFVGAAALF
ncbi:MAG: hypothetical protein KIS92_21980, partial [Planctomycetota bacterium]|nr:hypothetical protein [Planctomycetota bacterium]